MPAWVSAYVAVILTVALFAALVSFLRAAAVPSEGEGPVGPLASAGGGGEGSRRAVDARARLRLLYFPVIAALLFAAESEFVWCYAAVGVAGLLEVSSALLAAPARARVRCCAWLPHDPSGRLSTLTLMAGLAVAACIPVTAHGDDALWRVWLAGVRYAGGAVCCCAGVALASPDLRGLAHMEDAMLLLLAVVAGLAWQAAAAAYVMYAGGCTSTECALRAALLALGYIAIATSNNELRLAQLGGTRGRASTGGSTAGDTGPVARRRGGGGVGGVGGQDGVLASATLASGIAVFMLGMLLTGATVGLGDTDAVACLWAAAAVLAARCVLVHAHYHQSHTFSQFNTANVPVGGAVGRRIGLLACGTAVQRFVTSWRGQQLIASGNHAATVAYLAMGLLLERCVVAGAPARSGAGGNPRGNAARRYDGAASSVAHIVVLLSCGGLVTSVCTLGSRGGSIFALPVRWCPVAGVVPPCPRTHTPLAGPRGPRCVNCSMHPLR
jgi:hypothetical protein